MTTADGRDRYLELMKLVLTDYLRIDNEHAAAMPIGLVLDRHPVRRRVLRALERAAQRFGYTLVKRDRRPLETRRKARIAGTDWPPLGETMTGFARLDLLRSAIETVVAEDVPGDVLEAGVWRGGSCIFAAAVLASLGVSDRQIWVCDSFEGLPPPRDDVPEDRDFKLHDYAVLAVSEEAVRANFERYGLLGDHIRFVKGFFEESLKHAPVERIAILRLDGDMFSSTMSTLEPLYDKVSPGGYVVIDDYLIPACAEAVHRFRDARGITSELVRIDGSSAYWRKGGAAAV